jgi:hypothetical protein
MKKVKKYDIFRDGSSSRFTCKWVNRKQSDGYNDYECTVMAYSKNQAIHLAHSNIHQKEPDSIGITEDNPRFIKKPNDIYWDMVALQFHLSQKNK